MKTIETQIPEQRFLKRLNDLCKTKAKFRKGYEDKDVFVVKLKDNKFKITKHYAHLTRTGGYIVDCLYCQYSKNEKGHISVNYRIGKRLSYLIPFIIAFIIFIGVSQTGKTHHDLSAGSV